jgi:hypothetical protein
LQRHAHVVVVIPVLDDDRHLRLCVHALSQQDRALEDTLVVVVDNGPLAGADTRMSSLQDICSILPAWTVMHQPLRGSYAARNMAVTSVTSDIFAFTDSDCVPDVGWLSAGLCFLEAHPDVDAVAGKIEVFPRDPRRPTGPELYELVHGFPQHRYVSDHNFGATANLFVRRRAFDRIGPFDETLSSGGDKQWGHRLSQADMKMEYEPTAAVRHPARRTWRDLRQKVARVTMGELTIQARRGATRAISFRSALRALRPPLGAVYRARLKEPRITGLGLVRYGVTVWSVHVVYLWTCIRFRAE